MAGELSEKFAGEMILVVGRGQEDGTLYTHEEFLGAFEEALLARVESMVVPGMSSRSAMRWMARLRTPEAHQATLLDALRRLKRSGTPVDPTTLREGEHRVVAVFPVSA